MWESEAELRDFIKRKLEEVGHEVKKEVRLRGFKIDLIAEKKEFTVSEKGEEVVPTGTKKIVKGIEVKLNNHKEIYNAISRCVRLINLPELDEVYVAFPKLHYKKDVREVFPSVPVGVILANEKEISITPPAFNKVPAILNCPIIGHPPSVSPGDEFELRIGAHNTGGKDAFRVKLEWRPTDPFRKPKGEKNRKTVSKLEPGQDVLITFRVKVHPKAKLEKYPLITKISADGLEGKISVTEIPIEKKKETEKKEETELMKPPSEFSLREYIQLKKIRNK